MCTAHNLGKSAAAAMSMAGGRYGYVIFSVDWAREHPCPSVCVCVCLLVFIAPKWRVDYGGVSLFVCNPKRVRVSIYLRTKHMSHVSCGDIHIGYI